MTGQIIAIVTLTREFDPAKDALNIEPHHISLRRFLDMDMDYAILLESSRKGERRMLVVGPIDKLITRVRRLRYVTTARYGDRGRRLQVDGQRLAGGDGAGPCEVGEALVFGVEGRS